MFRRRRHRHRHGEGPHRGGRPGQQPQGDPRRSAPVSEAVGAEHVAVNYFRLDPGEAFSPGLHRHHDQEEVFVVLQGRAEFTVGADRETVTVAAGEAVRFEPGKFQTGRVPEDATEQVVSLAIGAPGPRHNWGEDLESLVHCRECEAEHPHESRLTGEGFELTYTGCGNQFTV